MKVRITDIPPEGFEAEFEIDRVRVNNRLELDNHTFSHSSSGKEPAGRGTGGRAHADSAQGASTHGPAYEFQENPKAHIDFMLEGTIMLLRGEVTGTIASSCARCAEEAKQELDVPVDMMLKPASERTSDEPEDLNFGYYEAEEVDCEGIAEEALMLAIPFVLLCRDDCKGLCTVCGTNLNQSKCTCAAESGLMSPFSILKDMKIVQ